MKKWKIVSREGLEGSRHYVEATGEASMCFDRNWELAVRVRDMLNECEAMRDGTTLLAAEMTLRDFFAAKAMQSEMITTFSDATPESSAAFSRAARLAGREPLEHLAYNAYAIADAMLAERAKGGDA